MFTLKHVLHTLSRPPLEQIIEEWQLKLGLPMNHHAQADEREHLSGLQNIILSALQETTTLSSLYQSLTKQEQTVLHYFIYYTFSDFLTYRQVSEQNAVTGNNAFMWGLTGLRRLGLIYTLRRQWGEVAYFMPEDLQAQMYTLLLAEKGYTQFNAVPEEDVTDQVEERMACFYQDVVLIADELSMQSEQSFPLTRQGTIHKKYTRVLQERMKDRPFMEDMYWPELDGRYPKYISLLLDFMTKARLLEWYDGEVCLQEGQAEHWFSKSKQEMVQHFLKYWTDVYMPSEVWIRRYLKDILLHWEEEGFVSTLYFVERWEDEYTLPPLRDIQDILEQQVWLPLRALGLIETATTVHGEGVWRFIHEGEDANAQIWVQPNFELFVPAVVRVADIWKMTRWFDLQEWQDMLRFTLSHRRVKLFLDRGGHMMDILEWLKKRVSTSIPEEIGDQLQRWQRERGQVRIYERSVIQIDDPQIAQAVQQLVAGEGFSITSIDEHLFLIPHHEKQQLLTVLHKRGFSIHEEKEFESEEEPKKRRDPELLKQTKAEVNLQDVESVVSQREDAAPEWGKLPDTWKKQFMRYDQQTLRRIVQTAVDQGLELLASDSSSDDKKNICPLECHFQDGHWVVFSEEAEAIKLDDINRIQLMLPGRTNS